MIKNKKQQLDRMYTFILTTHFFRARKVGRLERNLSTLLLLDYHDIYFSVSPIQVCGGCIYLFYLFSLYLKLTFPSLQLKPINVN